MTVPPWVLPPQLTSVGAARNRSVADGAATARCSSARASRTRWPRAPRSSRWRPRRDDGRPRTAGVHGGTSAGRPSSPTATKTTVQDVASANMPTCGSAADTVTSMCMLERPVCTSSARVSTSSPDEIGRANVMLPTYTSRSRCRLQPTAHAYAALSIHSRTRPAATRVSPSAATSVGVASRRSTTSRVPVLISPVPSWPMPACPTVRSSPAARFSAHRVGSVGSTLVVAGDSHRWRGS